MGAIIGWKLHSWISHREIHAQRPQGPQQAGGRQRLVAKALRFIRRRRVVSRAFGNYSHHPLPSVHSNPRQQPRRRRVATPGPKASPQASTSKLAPLTEGSTMDPTEEELNNLNTLAEVADWAGTTGELHTQLMDLLGKPTKLRDILFITRPAWDRHRISGDRSTSRRHAGEKGHDMTPVEESRIEIFRRVVFLCPKVPPDGPGTPGPPPAVVGAASATGRCGTGDVLMNEEAQAQQHCGPDPRCGDAATGPGGVCRDVHQIQDQVWGRSVSRRGTLSRSDQRRLCK